jgi:cell division protease FtsH
MSEKLGYITYEKERRPLFLDINPGVGTKDYSEETAREIDNEVRRIIDESSKNVKLLLLDNKDILEKVAKTLLEKESIDGEELRVLIDEKKKTGETGNDQYRKETS